MLGQFLYPLGKIWKQGVLGSFAILDSLALPSESVGRTWGLWGGTWGVRESLWVPEELLEACWGRLWDFVGSLLATSLVLVCFEDGTFFLLFEALGHDLGLHN